MRLAPAAASLGAFLACAQLVAPDARACFNGVAYEIDQTVRDVAQAERLLHRGNAKAAFLKAATVVEALVEGEEMSGKSPSYVKQQTARLRPRADRAMAVAVLRLAGDVDLGEKKVRPAWKTPEEAERRRKENLTWAQGVLHKQHQAAPEDVALRALHAEGLAALGRPNEALALLRALAEHDLMPDAFGWVLLARLEEGAGQPAARDAAVARCQAAVKKADRKRCVPIALAGQG